MKERNPQRKRALAKARDKVKRKKQLRADMETFLVKWRLRTIREPYDEYFKILHDGFRGFENMRNRELIKEFEFAYGVIRDKDKYEDIISAFTNSYGRRTKKCVPLYDMSADLMFADLTQDSESLMNRLMELAFDLDIVE